MNKTKAKRRGFSLLELLAVMSIIALLTTMAVTSYFSAIRGMARRGAVKQLANTLILARQRACMDSSRYSVVIFNEITGATDSDVTPSYVVCKELGRLTFIEGNSTFVDEFTPLESIFGIDDNNANGYLGSLRLYNLTRGGWSQVFPRASVYSLTRYSASNGTRYTLNTFALKKNSNLTSLNAPNWAVGDAYGVEATPMRSLPKGFEFTQLNTSASQVITITFLPDGRAQWTSGGGQIGISEMNPPKKSITMSVTDQGQVNYKEKWD